MSSFMNVANLNYRFEKAQNADSPEAVTVDFSSDSGYFVRENGEARPTVKNGVMSLSSSEGLDLAYMHVFEPNVKLRARMRFSSPNPPDSSFGIMLRYNATEAYVRCGILVKSGIAFIDSRQGMDFFAERLAAAKFTAEPDTPYELEFTADGSVAELKINGCTVVKADNVGHVSPGRAAFFAHRLCADIDFAQITLLSGEGTVWKNVAHTKLPYCDYIEGGSVTEMKDGTLRYLHASGVCFTSDGDGSSWSRADAPWTDPHGCPNILRLKSGELMKIVTADRDGVKYKASVTSADDGITWDDGGSICFARYENRTEPTDGKPIAVAGNMNDKLTQISCGRIFYCQNYECKPFGARLDGRTVFCEFYYSDDNGRSWTKSETDSWTLGGNSSNSVQWFGECKILECSDGTLRMYNSWNDYGCVVYSESTDMGVTWGELIPIPELVCARSSMQFVKDTYSESETDYYMVWCFSPHMNFGASMSRSRLSLARSRDGKSWEFLGDVWRWEHRYAVDSLISQICDPFIITTKDHVICGAGISEHLTYPIEKDRYHHAQRQHIWTIPKASLPEGMPVPKVRGIKEQTHQINHNRTNRGQS